MRAGRGTAAAAGFWAGACLAAGIGSALQAQPFGPAELPPSSFDGTQYVDSEGCAFVRAGISGSPMWVPRLSRDRERLCGYEPSFPGGVPAEAPRDPFAGVPNPLDVPVAVQPPGAGPAAEPAAAAAAPRPAAPRRVSPSPRVVAGAAPPPPPAAAAPVPPVRLTLAEACEGLSGVQPHIRDGRTGAPVDCGAGPAALGPLTLPAPVAQPLRMTLAEICADSAATGRRYVYQGTGAPVACAAPVAAAAGPGDARPDHHADHRAGARGTTGAEVARAATSPAAAAPPRPSPSLPASNPIGLAAVPTAPVAGYERVWGDGRINIHRGVPRPVAGPVVVGSRVVAPGVATIPVPVGQAPAVIPATGVAIPVPAPADVPATVPGPVATRAPAPRAAAYVQVGAFAEPANARRAVATLAAMGLPVGIASGRVQAVAAGPFGSPAEAQAALAQARAAGYGDAFIR